MEKATRGLILFALISISLISCQPDNSSPSNNSSTATRDNYVGTWLCKEYSKINGSSTFTVTISSSTTNATDLNLANFYLYGADAKARAVTSGFSITIPSQSFCNHTISGSGFLDQNKTTINWTYYVNDGQKTDSCTAIYTKK